MRHLTRRSLFPVAALATAVPALASCGAGGGAGTASDGGGDRTSLVLGTTADIYGWDPANQPAYQNWSGEAVWEHLVRRTPENELLPAVAEEWEISEDNRSFTAHVRPDQLFSDGSPITADSVQASFEYVRDTGASTNDFADIAFEAPDDTTITITWPEPQQVLRNKVSSVKIMPRSYLEEKNWDSPVGSGPYVFDSAASTTGSSYSFTRNEHYWDPESFPFDTVEIRVFTGESAAVSALTTGQIHGVLVGQNSVQQVEGAGLETMRYDLNIFRLILSDRLGEKIPALGDTRVRQAMNMVFDKESIAKNLFLDMATPTAQVFLEGTPAYIEGLEDPYPFDVEAAKALMEESGFSAGFDIELPTMEGQSIEVILPYVQQQLAEIGIRATEVPLTGANAIGDLLSGDYPVVLWPLGGETDSALQIYIEATPEGWWNLQHQEDEFIAERWEKMATADADESAALQKEINQYLVDEAWYAPMVRNGNFYAFDPAAVEIPTQTGLAGHPALRDFA